MILTLVAYCNSDALELLKNRQFGRIECGDRGLSFYKTVLVREIGQVSHVRGYSVC